MELSLILGILSLVISIIAVGIAIKSDRKMKSIANLEYDVRGLKGDGDLKGTVLFIARNDR